MISNYISKHVEVLNKINWVDFDKIIKLISNVISNNKKIFTAGNGGSGHTANHYITDWAKMYNVYTNKQLIGIPLSANVGMITAYGNDYSFEDIFSKQLDAYGSEGDMVFLISGSGNSENLLRAADKARLLNITTVAIIGYDGGNLINCVDYKIHVPSFDMQICEDIHLMIGHIIMKKICNLNIN
jgi:D-sedoheptulose 7-phosphate isomerase